MKKLEDLLHVTFKDKQHLSQALIHRSYLNEHRGENMESNERYEFLGDAVLELWSSENLFQLFPSMNEGDLTNLRALIVRTENLAAVARTINLGDFVMVSRGEEANGGRLNQSILADTFEAVIGALFLDQGYPACTDFLKFHLGDSMMSYSQQKMFKDPKSLFQEIAQAKTGVTPHYQTLNESGPDHKKTFEVGVYVGDKLIATGSGASKQSAEEDASSKATKNIDSLV